MIIQPSAYKLLNFCAVYFHYNMSLYNTLIGYNPFPDWHTHLYTNTCPTWWRVPSKLFSDKVRWNERKIVCQARSIVALPSLNRVPESKSPTSSWTVSFSFFFDASILRATSDISITVPPEHPTVAPPCGPWLWEVCLVKKEIRLASTNNDHICW